MRKTFLLICFWGMLQTLFAADTLFVREQQVPILIDRIDNVLYEMRIPARKGDVLNEITLRFGDEVDLSTIAAVRLFIAVWKLLREKTSVSVLPHTYPITSRVIPERR